MKKLTCVLNLSLILCACNNGSKPSASAVQLPAIGESAPVISPPMYLIVESNLSDQTNNYFSESNYPYNQSEFGICASASLNSLMGYIINGNTNSFSLPGFMALSYVHPFNINGVNNNYYLFGSPNISNIYAFVESYGFVLRNPAINESGYFVTLYNEYKAIQPLAITNLMQTALFSSEVENIPESQTKPLNMSNYKTLGLVGDANSQTPSQRLALTLDQGYLIQFMIYPINIGLKLQYKYSYNPETKLLTRTADQLSESNNTWTTLDPTVKNFNLGSQHWIYVFSYATTVTGEKIFFVRNSWGNGKGENGNYYMTESFINGSIYYNNQYNKLASNFIKYKNQP